MPQAAAIARLIHQLETEPQAMRRLQLCERLAEQVAGTPALLATYIPDASWTLARNLALVLGELRDEGSLPPLAALATHPEYRVRREVIDSLRKIGGPAASRVLRAFCSDPDPRIRHYLITRMDARFAASFSPWLLRIVASPIVSRQGLVLKAAALSALRHAGRAQAHGVLARFGRRAGARNRWRALRERAGGPGYSSR